MVTNKTARSVAEISEMLASLFNSVIFYASDKIYFYNMYVCQYVVILNYEAGTSYFVSCVQHDNTDTRVYVVSDICISVLC